MSKKVRRLEKLRLREAVPKTKQEVPAMIPSSCLRHIQPVPWHPWILRSTLRGSVFVLRPRQSY